MRDRVSEGGNMGVMRRGGWPSRRRLLAGLLGAVALVLCGDHGVRSASSPTNGIDPLDVLNFQTIPNVLFVVDTSSTMGGTVTDPNYFVGGDNLLSRLYQVKVAIRHTIQNNQGKANFGVAQFGPGNARKKITRSGIGSAGVPDYNRGPFIYVTDNAFTKTAINTIANTPNNPPLYGDILARIFQPGIGTTVASSAVKATDYDWVDDTTGLACPSTCSYNSTTLTTTCTPGGVPALVSANKGAGCEQEFLRSLIATENGFGTPESKTPFVAAKSNPASGKYHFKSRVFFNNVFIRWSAGPGDGSNGDAPGTFTQVHAIPASNPVPRGLLSVEKLPFLDPNTGITWSCPAPPPGLLGDDVKDSNDGVSTRPCFILQILAGNTTKGTKSGTAYSYLASAAFGLTDPNEGCSNGQVDDGVQACGHSTADDTKLLTQGSLRLELPFANPATGGTQVGLTPANLPVKEFVGTNPNTAGGIQLGGDGFANGDNTPIAATLTAVRDYYNNTIFPSRPAIAAGKQKNFTILVIDGDENCGGDAVAAAQALYDNAPSPDNRIETVVVVFPTNSATTALADAIAMAGSGGTRRAIQGGALQGNLDSAVNIALAQTLSGEYSAADVTVTESVYEFFNPLPPATRYSTTQPIVFQSTFSMPGFHGHLHAFWNDPADGLDVAVPRWDGANDAGDKLLQRVTIPAAGATFDQLTGGATASNILTSSALVKRRIFTTIRNGVFTPAVVDVIRRTAQADVRTLWPPSSDVDPATYTVAGVLDDQLAIGTGSSPVLTAAQLETEFGACTGSPLPLACTTGTATAQRAQRAKEARQRILAFTAGAQFKGGSVTPQRDALGNILYERRAWILGEATLSAPAIVTPPLQSEPQDHIDEYRQFRNSPRNSSGKSINGISQGFGLRNPDLDNDPTSAADNTLKPALSVVYLGTNEGLHAFRAGPCVVCSQAETGGEEMYAFVPFDQLGDLRENLQPQVRDPHTYMIASSLRFGEVFLPALPEVSAFTETISSVNVTGKGVWRTVLVFGRGIGGKSYTALDITGPGPFTANSLETSPPIVYWNRGNPDTQDGTAGGTKDNDNFDFNAYARMGETWSTPGLANIDKTNVTSKKSKLGNATCSITSATATNLRRPAGVEFVFYTGSGYPTATSNLEGTTFYGLDALTGDVITAADVCDRTGAAFQNALVANPAVFTAAQLIPGFVGNSAASKATRVYVGDINGRLWKFNTSDASTPVLFTDLGASQPVANAVALLNFDSDGTGAKPHVYVETGNDRRVASTVAAPFKMFGFRDPTADGNTQSNKADQLFALDLPVDSSASPVNGFRGTVQPATAFNTAVPPQGRVFYVGTKFNPAGVNCVSTFDSILFAVGAQTGQAAYDFGASFTLTGQKAIAVRVDRGRLVIDQGVNVSAPPSAPAPPAGVPGASGTGEVFLNQLRPNSPVCR
jgi:hypothetical protein